MTYLYTSQHSASRQRNYTYDHQYPGPSNERKSDLNTLQQIQQMFLGRGSKLCDGKKPRTYTNENSCAKYCPRAKLCTNPP